MASGQCSKCGKYQCGCGPWPPVTGRDVDVLAAPCRWCGYNGEGYWQVGTHAITCPWRQVGGDTCRHVLDTLNIPTPTRGKP